MGEQNNETSSSKPTDEQLIEKQLQLPVVSGFDYYDWVLATIPILIITGIASTIFQVVSVTAGTLAFSITSSAVFAHAIFYNPPTSLDDRDRK